MVIEIHADLSIVVSDSRGVVLLFVVFALIIRPVRIRIVAIVTCDGFVVVLRSFRMAQMKAHDGLIEMHESDGALV
ncbi:hypothetical protein LBMAG46_20380 [Planctomycetia bacterium]|nr:hypothetical protein LBMAG46_20380 [Planctomycetia bacterium]